MFGVSMVYVIIVFATGFACGVLVVCAILSVKRKH